METLEPCVLLGRMEDDVATVETVHTFLKKLKLTYELAKLLGLNPKELPVGTPTDTCTPTFIPAPFTTDKREMHPKRSSVGGG